MKCEQVQRVGALFARRCMSRDFWLFGSRSMRVPKSSWCYSIVWLQTLTQSQSFMFCDGSELCLTLSRQSPRWNTALLRYIKEMNACTLAHLVTSLSSSHHWTGLRCVCSSNKVDQLKPSLSYPCLLHSFFFCSPMCCGQVIITHSLFLQFQRFEMKDDSYWVLSDPFVARNKEWLVFLKGLWICVTGDWWCHERRCRVKVPIILFQESLVFSHARPNNYGKLTRFTFHRTFRLCCCPITPYMYPCWGHFQTLPIPSLHFFF